MNRPTLVRALVALLAIGLSTFFVVTKDPQLGLDLRGGTSITFETESTPTTEANAENTDRTLEVLRRRVDALGVTEPTLARSGERRIIVELPGVEDAAQAAEIIGKTAQLTIHPVLAAQTPELPQPLPSVDAGPVDPASPGAAGPASPGAAGAASPPAGPAVSSAPVPGPQATTNGRALPQGLDAAAGRQGQVPSPAPAGPQLPASTGAASPAAVSPPPSGAASTPADASPGASPGATPSAAPFDPEAPQQTIVDDNGLPIVIGPAALSGDGIGDAGVGTDPQTNTGRFVTIDFKGDGGRQWEDLTAAAACNPVGDPKRKVAIVLDNEVISSPPVADSVQCNIGIQGGSTQITGAFTRDEADNLATLIKGGALPLELNTLSRRQVGPTLGEEAIDASIEAGIIGLALTGIFLMIVYRFVGFLAVVALGSYGVIAFGSLVALGATLTLPGLAGLLLSVGLAIDANVLVFERAKEEYAASRSKKLLPALDNGFAKAFSAVADSNVTTILAAALLFLLASGTVKGFGVTLVLGVLASLISALVVTRVLTEFGLKRGLIASHPGFTGLSTLGRVRPWLERRKPDIMQYRRIYLRVTAGLLVFAVLGMVVRGFNFGVEFTGGRTAEFATSQQVSVQQARNQIEQAGFPTAVVQESDGGDGTNLIVRTANISDDEFAELSASLAEVGGEVTVVDDDIVGPTLGSELRQKAIIALLVALFAQLIYLAVRFRWSFAASTVLAMFHDVVLVLGLFAWLGKPIDGLFLAAALTIIGVSVNDSVVTMDRIRETWAQHRTRPLPQVINSALIATAPRTFNTGLGAFFILGALTVLGGRSLTDFALALLIGLFVGTYSSAFVASPLLLLLEERSNTPPPMPKRKAPAVRSRPSSVKKRPSAPRPAAT